MDIRTYASILLAGQSVAIIFMLLILKRQIGLFRTNIQADLLWFRRVQFTLTFGIFICSLIFVSVNVLTIINVVTRSTHKVNIVGLVYGLAVTAALLMFSLLTWLLYRMAAKVILIDQQKTAQNNQEKRVE